MTEKNELRELFDEWWDKKGRFIDPDTEDVPWFDKRKELSEYAFDAGFTTRPSGWIPVSERLPEEAGEYITTSLRWSDSQDYSVEWSYFNSKLQEWELPTIAWMENPAPYIPPQEESRDE